MTDLLAGRMPRLEPSAWRYGDDGTLADALERLLEGGAAVSGDVVLSLAGVDLAWLGLRLVLGDADHAPPGALLDPSLRPPPEPRPEQPKGRLAKRSHEAGSSLVAAPRRRASRSDEAPDGSSRQRSEDGLVRLVLSLVELVRQVLERQALRKADQGSLSDEQVERLGLALLDLSDRMEELKAYFGLEDDDLQIRLGRIEDVA